MICTGLIYYALGDGWGHTLATILFPDTLPRPNPTVGRNKLGPYNGDAHCSYQLIRERACP